jgi:hypothetical protein
MNIKQKNKKTELRDNWGFTYSFTYPATGVLFDFKGVTRGISYGSGKKAKKQNKGETA